MNVLLFTTDFLAGQVVFPPRSAVHSGFSILQYGIPVRQFTGETIVAVTLRLARHGQKNRPYYRIVATETTSRRDGKFIEIVGTYNTMTEPASVKLYEDKIKKWVGHGAQVSSVVRSLIVKNIPGLLEAREEHKKKKTQETRRRRKERAKSASK